MTTALSAAQAAFIELLHRRNALRFGDFTLKSGRKSPYFINLGCLHQGGDVDRLGAAYADAIQRRFGDGIEVIFGPAYKGIPLAIATAAAYERLVGRPVGWTFDRKEVKDHGDGGLFVGAPLAAGTRVVVVDDVLTAGTALRETLVRLAPTGCTVAGGVVAVDRMERGTGAVTALQELAAASGIAVVAIVTIAEAAERLHADGRLTEDDRQRITAHLREHGA